MNRRIKDILTKSGLFDFLRFSPYYSVYRRYFKPAQYKQYLKEINFYQSFLPPCELIFDIGAFDGHKTEVFNLFAKRIVACEPDPFHADYLNRRFRKNKNISIEEVAVTNYNDQSTFHFHYFGSAFNTINKEWMEILEKDELTRWNEKIKFSRQSLLVNCVTLSSLIDKYGTPDFIKIDAEGSEPQILETLTTLVKSLSFEVLLPEFRDKTIKSIKEIHKLNSSYLFNYAVDEELKLPEFLNAPEFLKVIENLDTPHLEVIVKSS